MHDLQEAQALTFTVLLSTIGDTPCVTCMFIPNAHVIICNHVLMF